MIAKAFSTGNWNTFKNFVDVVLPSTMKKIQSVFVPKIDSVLNSMLGNTTEVRKDSVVVSELIESRQFVGIGVTLTYGIDDFRVPEAPQAAIDSDVNAITEAIKMEGVELKEVKIDTGKGILEIKASLPFGGTDDNEDRSTSFLQ